MSATKIRGNGMIVSNGSKMLAGTNSHHIIEGAFKSAARSLRQATEKDLKFVGEIPSTKGVL